MLIKKHSIVLQTMIFTFPWPTKALSPNWRGHWAQKAAAVKAYRTACKRIVCETATDTLSLPPDATIDVLMRFYPPSRRAYDWDNCLASFKSGLDGLADGLGVNDNLFKPSVEVMPGVLGQVVVEVTVQ